MASSARDKAASAAPRDAAVVHKVLRSMGVESHEPRVTHALLELMHRHCTEVIHDGLDYAAHAGRAGKLEAEDVHLAMKLRAQEAQIAAPRLVQHIERERNRKPLPVPGEPQTGPKNALQLPVQRLCQLTPSYQLRPRPRPEPEPAEVEPARAPALAPPAARRAGKRPLQVVLSEQAVRAAAGGSAEPPAQRARTEVKTEVGAADVARAQALADSLGKSG